MSVFHTLNTFSYYFVKETVYTSKLISNKKDSTSRIHLNTLPISHILNASFVVSQHHPIYSLRFIRKLSIIKFLHIFFDYNLCENCRSSIKLSLISFTISFLTISKHSKSAYFSGLCASNPNTTSTSYREAISQNLRYGYK